MFVVKKYHFAEQFMTIATRHVLLCCRKSNRKEQFWQEISSKNARSMSNQLEKTIFPM